MIPLLVLSYANKETNTSLNYKNSLKKWKYKFKVIGYGEKWEGFMTKIRAYHNFLSKLKKLHIVCITDCYDVLACGSPDELLRKYKKFKKNVVISTQDNCRDCNCIELKNWWKLNSDRPYVNRYLNSGFIIGPSDKICNILKFMFDLHMTDDQLALCRYVEKYPDEVDLDLLCSLVGTIRFTINRYDWKKGRVIDTKTNIRPCFVHFPGSSSDMMFRLNYFGKYILGTKYLSVPLDDRINGFLVWIFSRKSILIPLLISLIILIKFPKLIPIFFLLLFFLIE